jgi:hypothetical protein
MLRKRSSLITVALIFASSLTPAQSPPPAAVPESQTLSVGVIVQLTTPPVLFVMNPTSGVDAVDLRSGRLLWHSTHAAAPLLARGNALLALAPPLPGKTGGRLFVLDTHTGDVVAQLPDLEIQDWSVVLEQGLRTSLEIYGCVRRGRDFLVWKGETRDVSPVLHPARREGQVARGAVEVDLDRATLAPTTDVFPDRFLAMKSDGRGGSLWEAFETGGIRVTLAKLIRHNSFIILLRRARGRELLPDVILAGPATAFSNPEVSVDRRHVLVAYYKGKGGYDVTTFDAATGKRLRHLVTDSWPAPFLIWDDLLVSYTPSVVKVADLASGKALFEHAVRDLAYRGPYPPGASRP